MSLEVIKYKGTNKFIAALVRQIEEKTENYFFFFMKTAKPEFILNQEQEYAYGLKGQKLCSFDRQNITFSIESGFINEDKLFYLIKIQPSEFDSLYNLLECVWND